MTSGGRGMGRGSGKGRGMGRGTVVSYGPATGSVVRGGGSGSGSGRGSRIGSASDSDGGDGVRARCASTPVRTPWMGADAEQFKQSPSEACLFVSLFILGVRLLFKHIVSICPF